MFSLRATARRGIESKMSYNAAMLEQMKAEGLDLDACIRIVKAGEKKSDPTNAERQARHRAKGKRNAVTVTRVTPNDNNTLTPGSEAKASSPFSECPNGVDPQHWADFRKARKRKSCTDSETAYRAVLRDLETFSDDEWPPGRLVQRSAENGWAKIVNPRESKYDRPANQQCGKTTAAIAALGGFNDDTPM